MRGARTFGLLRRLEKDGHRLNKSNDDTNWDETKSLSLRCAKVLALEWRSMLPLDLQDEYIQLWKKESRASSLVLVSLLASAVYRAQCDLEVIEREIMQEGSTVKWEDIAGLESAKKMINEIIVWPLLKPEFFKGLRQPPTRGCRPKIFIPFHSIKLIYRPPPT